MFDWGRRKTYYEGTIEPDDTQPVDFVFDEGLVEKIYSSWDEDKYGPLLDFGAGVKAITISMLLVAGIEFVESMYGIGPKRASDIIDKAEVSCRQGAAYI